MTEQSASAPTVETRRIEDIIIGSRFREDLGDIDDLANKIKDVGLLSPVGITPENKLIYGARRIEAYKRLGRTEIPAYIIPLDDIIKGELIENTARKDFTFSERQAILEEIESRRIGHRVSKEKVSNLQTFQQNNKGKPSVNIVADYTGISPRQLSKEKAIVQAVKEKPQLKHVIDKLDRGEISVPEAEKEIEFEEDYDAQEKKMGEWRELRTEVMEEDDNKCRHCGEKGGLDVYTIIPYHDKYDKENLETLCKDCRKLRMDFYEPYALHNSLLSIFQHLTGMSGKKFFRYWVVGYLKNKHDKDHDLNDNSQDSVSRYIEEQAKDPYAKLRAASNEELVSKTRSYRVSMLKSSFTKSNTEELSDTHNVLAKLLPILSDYDKMILNELEARKKNAAMEGV
jgi:ParB-like chromosome segregation protein Spo0J